MTDLQGECSYINPSILSTYIRAGSVRRYIVGRGFFHNKPPALRNMFKIKTNADWSALSPACAAEM